MHCGDTHEEEAYTDAPKTGLVRGHLVNVKKMISRTEVGMGTGHGTH